MHGPAVQPESGSPIRLHATAHSFHMCTRGSSASVSDASPAAPTSQMTPGQPGSLSCQQQGRLPCGMWQLDRVSASLIAS